MSTTAIDHVVAFKFREDVTEEEVKKFEEGIKSLIRCEGVLSVTVGKIIAEDYLQDRSQGAHYAIRVRLADKAALKSYTNDEYHEKIKKECVGPLLAGPTIAFDWESEEVTK